VARLVIGYTLKPVIYGSLAAQLAGVPKHFSMITGLERIRDAMGLAR
jgi:hypothetical protein